MIKLLKYINKWAYVLIFLVIGLVIVQVYSDLELPTRLSNILTSASTADGLRAQGLLTPDLETKYFNEVLHNGLEMLGFAALSLISSFSVGFLASRISASFSYNLRKAVYKKNSELFY